MNLFQLRELAYLAYFDLPDSTWIGNSVKAFAKWLLNQSDHKKDEHLAHLNDNIYQQVVIEDYENENETTGLAVYLFQFRDEHLFVFRGSESYHAGTEAKGWQDWEDNFDTIFNENTVQEQAALEFVNHHHNLDHITLCGHSKGGKLAVYTSLKIDDSMNDHMEMVVGFNAPGILPEMKKQYRKRIQSAAYQKKVYLLDNEYDIVSALFYPVVKPIFIKSKRKGDTLENVIKAHGLFEYEEDGMRFVTTAHRAAYAREIHFLFNTLLTRLSPQELRVLTLPAFAYFALDTPLESFIRYLYSMLQQNQKQLDQVHQEQTNGVFKHLSKKGSWHIEPDILSVSACNHMIETHI